MNTGAIALEVAMPSRDMTPAMRSLAVGSATLPLMLGSAPDPATATRNRPSRQSSQALCASG